MALISALYGTNLIESSIQLVVCTVPPTRPLLVSDFNIWCKLCQSILRRPLKAFNGAQGTKNCQLSISDSFSLLKLDFSNGTIALQYILHQKRIYSAFMTLFVDFKSDKN